MSKEICEGCVVAWMVSRAGDVGLRSSQRKVEFSAPWLPDRRLGRALWLPAVALLFAHAPVVQAAPPDFFAPTAAVVGVVSADRPAERDYPEPSGLVELRAGGPRYEVSTQAWLFALPANPGRVIGAGAGWGWSNDQVRLMAGPWLEGATDGGPVGLGVGAYARASASFPMSRRRPNGLRMSLELDARGTVLMYEQTTLTDIRLCSFFGVAGPGWSFGFFGADAPLLPGASAQPWVAGLMVRGRWDVRPKNRQSDE